MIIWPERPGLEGSMPMCFRNEFVFNITAIIDCLERFIDRSTNSTGPTFTQSNYESHNGRKYLIGTAPQGTILFLFLKVGVEKLVTKYN